MGWLKDPREEFFFEGENILGENWPDKYYSKGLRTKQGSLGA